MKNVLPRPAALFLLSFSWLTSNDNWPDTQGGIISSTGLAPTDPHEAALFITLTAGEYTAVVQGVNGTGVGQVEVSNIL